MVRLVGMFVLTPGVVVVRFIRFRAVEQYPATLVLRTLLLPILAWLYVPYGDPMPLVLIVIVAGYLLTWTCFLWDRATARRSRICG